MRHTPIVVVECLVQDLQFAQTTLENDVEQYLRDTYITIEIGQDIRLPDLANVESLQVVELIVDDDDPEKRLATLADSSIAIHIFHLHCQPRTNLEVAGLSASENTETNDGEGREQFRAHITTVPHAELQGLWETLVFDEPLHIELLGFLLQMIAFARSKTRIFNRIVLLYGPPGTGKTTLCRGLVQKLAIRLKQEYNATKLIELDAAALFSKYFGESSKLVNRIFDTIESILVQEPQVLVCVFIDEIESLAGSRQQSAGAHEPKDSMRALNALLVALDRLSRHSNVIVLCTSNLVQTMVGLSIALHALELRAHQDSAILDRIDVKQYIPLPSVKTRYEMFRRSYLDLIQSGVISPLEQALHVEGELPEYPNEYVALNDGDLGFQSCETLPTWEIVDFSHGTKETSIPYRLSKLAEKSAGSFNPTQIFADDVTEEKGENARLSAFVGAIAVGDLVKSTLGPKGMDKILQSASTGEIMVTNDGATILKSIALDNAAAKVLVNISKVQDDEVGDGTTSVTVLAAELLREAEKLVGRKIHPQTIIEGYRIASNVALEALGKTAQDHSKDKDAFRKDLMAIARTTLSSKVLSQDRDHFAALACDAVLRLQGSTDLSHIQLIKKAGGKLSDSYLDEGFILDKRIGVNQPKRLENAKILVANTAMDTDKVKIFGARVKVDSTGGLAKLEEAEREKMKQKVEKIKSHGINCFVNRQLIYNRPEQLFSDAGIVSIEHADFDGIERLALVTGGEIASTFDHPEMVKLGHCDLIEEVIIGEDTLIKFSGVAAGQACTIVLRGATEQLLDEAERSLHDALAVLSQTVREPKTTLGGGCAEMVMAKAVEQESPNVAGKKAIAVDAFATALRQLPTILADNAGFDSSDLVARLKKEIYNGETSSGLDLLIPGGGIADMREKGVIESYKLKRAVVSSAAEAAELLLRVDSIVRCAPRKRERM
ncbi:MAG: hypothetical protein Q9209_006189 [Squamulea sp. 1 TL-2023]